MGIKIAVQEENIAVDSADKGRVSIIYKSPEISFNSAVYKPFHPEMPDFELPFAVDELALTYGPQDGFCQINSLSGIHFDLNVRDFIQTLDLKEKSQESKEIPDMGFDYQIGRIVFNDFNIKPILEYQGDDFLAMIGRQMAANQDFSITADNLAVEISIADESVSQISGSIDRIEASTVIAPEFFNALLDPEESEISFTQILAEGRAPFALNNALQNLQLKVITKQQNINVGLESMQIEYYLKPSSQKDLFDFGAAKKIKAFQITGLKQPKLESLAGLKEFNSSFSVQRITPAVIDRYFALIRAAKKMGAAEQNAETQQELSMQGMTLVSSLVQAKPVISLAISPLEHSLGKIEMTSNFQFVRMGPPVGKATVTIFSLTSLAEKLLDQGITLPANIEAFMAKLPALFPLDANGNGTLTLELKEEDTANLYVNGSPMGFGGLLK